MMEKFEAVNLAYRFYLCESKIFAVAFTPLWLSLAAFMVIYQ
jgi:hypothetical protein